MSIVKQENHIWKNWFGGIDMHVTIWVSDKCNLHCKYCYEGENKPGLIMNERICKETLFFIRREMHMKKDDRLSITFHGGEPLLGFDCIKFFLREIKAFFPECRFSMTTNLTILTDEMAEVLINEIDDLSISIDGDCMAHDLNRIFANGCGTYGIVKANVMKILPLKKNIRARMTVVPETVGRLSLNVEHLILLGFKIIEPILDFTNQKWCEKYIELYNEELKKVVDILETYQDVDVPILYSAACKNRNSPCDGGSASFNIATDGSIYPCILTVNQEEFIIGHVNTEIDDVKVKWIQDLDKVKNEDCIGCQRYHYCKSTRCKLVNYINTGNYNTPLPLMCMSENSAVKIAKYYLRKKEYRNEKIGIENNEDKR